MKKDLIKEVLNDLRAAGIEASAIVSRDGILIQSDIPSTMHPETFAAMSATMLGAAETAMDEIKRGIPDRVIVETKEAKLITIGTGPKALLTAMTKSTSPLGMALVQLEKAKEKIKEILEEERIEDVAYSEVLEKFRW
jgi:hypothetical protein